jgi:hypothetical protein
MHYSNHIGIVTAKYALAGFLFIPWTLMGEPSPQLRLPHLSPAQSAEFEAGKQAASSPASESRSPESRAAKSALEKLDDESLVAFSVRLRKLVVLNPESLDTILGEVSSGELDPSLKESLQALIRTDGSAKSTLASLVKEVLSSRLEGEGSGKSISERLAELERLENQKSEDFLRGLDEKLALERLLGGSEDSNSGQSPDGGSPSSPASSSPAAPAKSGKSKSASDPREDRQKESKSADNRLNEILKSLDATRQEKASDETNEPEAPSISKKKKSNADAAESALSDKPNVSTPLPDASTLATNLAKSKPTLTGNTVGLSPIPPPGEGAGGAPVSPSQGGSFGPMQGSVGSGIAAATSGQSFPFFASESPAAPPAPQKFEYSRDNPYGNSNGDGVVADGMGNETTDDELSERVSASADVHLDRSRRVTTKLLTGQDEPAFAKALSLAISGLCTKGALDCETSKKGAR